MTKPKRQFIDTEYGQLHLRIAKPDTPSAQRPLICLHQSPKSGREFVKFMEKMGQERIVIAPDYPGYGESDPPPVPLQVSISDYARNIWQAIDALDVGKVDLFGNHTGSCVATEMATMRPDDVGSIVMVSAMVLSPAEQEKSVGSFETIPLDTAGTRFSHIWNMIEKYRSPGMTLEMMSESFAENLRGGEAYEAGHYAAFSYNDLFADRISKLPHRITVLNPEDMMHEATLRVAPLLQNGEVIDCPDWENYVVNIHTDDVVLMLKNALDG